MEQELNLESAAQNGGNWPPSRPYNYVVNLYGDGNRQLSVCLKDATPSGTKILSLCNQLPTNSYQLLTLDSRGLRQVYPSDSIDLEKQQVKCFFAFESDRLWFSEFNGKRFACEKIENFSFHELGTTPRFQFGNSFSRMCK